MFYSYYKWNPNKVDESLIKNKWSAISTVLIIFSILSIPGALIGIAILSGINNLFTENMWIFFLFTPIPIASIVIGSYLKSKGIYKYQKNIVVGIIMTALLCIYGSFSFIFPDIYSHSDEPILQIEKNIGIDIPSHSRINTQDWTKGTQSVSRGYIFYTSDVYFESDAADKFEEQIKNDGKWISDVPTEIVGITSPFADLQSYDYIIIYNTVTQDINKLPKENGTYRFVNVLYDCVSNKMKIVEYEIEYVK